MDNSELELVMEARRAIRSGMARALRVAAGLTQAQVGAACGVSDAAVSRWEHGQRQPRGPAAATYGRVLRTMQQNY